MFVQTSNKRGCTSCACSNSDGSAHARYLSSRFLVYSSRCCCCCRSSRCVPRFEVNNLRSFSSSQTRLAASSLSRSEGFLCRSSRLFPLQQTTSTSRPVKRSRVSSLSLYVQPRRQQGRANLVSSTDASLSLNVSDAFAAGAASTSTIPRHRPRPARSLSAASHAAVVSLQDVDGFSCETTDDDFAASQLNSSSTTSSFDTLSS